MEAIWYSGRGDQAPGMGGGRGDRHANRAQQPQVAQPVEGDKTDSQIVASQSQRISLEAEEEDVQQAPGVEQPNNAHVPSDENSDQSDTIEP